jgi:uncharacterized membrane protein
MMLDYNGGMMWGYNDSWTWVWMAGMMVVVMGAIIVLAVLAIRTFASPKSGDQAVELLRRRLAGGEITQDEFEKTRKALQN